MTVASRNLSLKGLACAPDPRLVENACCRVVISLAPGLQTVIKGRIIRADEAGAAIDFLAMDPESFVHLKKIVEYHSQNPEELTRELLTPAFPLFRSPTPFVGRKPRK
jgi:DNA-directed RNA polymerase subunit E'/Rpb7